MELKQIKKKMKLKKQLMLDAGEYFEGLCDYDEPARVIKAKDFAKKSRKSFMRDYKKALAAIDKEFVDKPLAKAEVQEKPDLVKDKERDK